MEDIYKIIGKNIEKYRKALDLSAEELANRVGLTKKTIRRYETGEIKILSDRLVDIANALYVDPKVLYEGTEIISEPKEEYRVSELIRIPFYGSIAAGALATIEPVTNGNVEYMHIPRDMLGKHRSSKGLFMLKVNGESMNKLMPNGSYVICKPVELSEIKNGDIVIFSYDHEYSMKRFRRDDNNKLLIFSPESTDPKFYDIVVPFDAPNDLKIYAKVLWYAVRID